MDTRRLISAVLLTFALVVLFQMGLAYFGRQMGWDTAPKRTDQQAQSTTEPSSPATGPTTSASLSPTTGPTVRAAGLHIASAGSTDAVAIGSDKVNDAKYRMAVTISPQGAGLDSVVLNQFKRSARGDERYVFQQPYPGAPAATRALATRSVTIDGQTIDLQDVLWTREPAISSESDATFSTTIADDNGPVVKLIKHFEVTPVTDPGAGYELVTRLTWQNLADRAITVRATLNGPATPPRELDYGPDRYIISGYYDGAPNVSDRVTVENRAVESFTADAPSHDLTISQKYQLPLYWAGAQSTYFDAIVRPVPGEGQSVPSYIQKALAYVTNPAAPVEQHHIAMTFETTDLRIEPGQSQSHELRVFLGPKQRSLLKDAYYSVLGYSKTLVLTGGLCGICTFQWLIDLLVLMLRGFHWLFGGFAGHGDWGLAIIGLVAVVRIALHPITKKSQVSMMRMQKMGPEMERLRQKYGDNKEELSKAMMQFYKEQGVGPYLGCLPMFLQMPIWIALWSALNSTFELRQASFLWGLTWINDLSKPDHLIEFSHPVRFFFLHISGLNVLPLLLAVVFYFQMKLQPKPATMTKEQEQQQKIMMWMMPVLFPLMLYSGPSGLNLYILASTFIGIIESKVIRKHIQQREEAEKAGREIVDAGKGFGGGPASAAKVKRVEPARGGLGGWLASLQQKADQIQRDADRKRGKGKA